eukprot:188100_1
MAHNDKIITGDRAASLLNLNTENAASPIPSSVIPALTRTEEGGFILPNIPENKSSHKKLYRFTISVPPKEHEGVGSDNENNKKKNNDIELIKLQEVTYNGSIDETISECVICLQKTSNCVFIPCGHLNCCYDCGCKVYLTRAKCSICNTSVREIVRVYYNYDVSVVTKQE